MFHLNEGQEEIVRQAVDWYNNSSEQVFQFSGAAGTGKSVVMNAIINRLGLNMYDIAPMSYIGSAAIIMRLKGLINAKTIHSWLFEPKVVHDGEYDPYLGRKKSKLVFVPKPLGDKKLICIDEAGCVPYSLKKEIESRGVKVLACGDLNQLPPVGDMRPAYLYTGKVHFLTEIMRQSQNSPIVYLAHRLLNGYPIAPGIYGQVLVVCDDEITTDMIYNSEVVLCGRNSTRDKFNKYIRQRLFNIDSPLPLHGEKLVCRKNNWRLESDGINLANGLIGSVYNYPDITGFNGKTFKIDFKPSMIDSPFKDVNVDYKYFSANTEEKRLIKKNPYAKGEKFEYAYSLTTHIAQGSQYRQGLYFQEYLNKMYNRNLNYTGITRFSDRCIYVIPHPKYF